MYRLVLESGPHTGETRDISEGTITFGRGPQSPWCFANDPTVSTSHLELSNLGGKVTIRDLGSSDGTFINEVPVQSNLKFEIRPGDKIRIGQSQIRLEIPNRSTAIGAPPRLTKPNSDGKSCTQCNAAFGFLGAKARNRDSQDYCNQCATMVQEKIERFRNALQREFALWNETPGQLASRISERANSIGIDQSLALSRTADVTTAFLQRVLTFLLQDGHLAIEEERVFHEYRQAVSLSEHQIAPLMRQVQHYAFLRELQSGKLPKVTPSVMLPSGEIAHIEVAAIFSRELTASVRHHHGLFLVTNSRLIFTQTDSPFEVALSKVHGITFFPPNHFELQLARRHGTGVYQSDHAFYLVEVAKAALEFHLRHRIVQQSASRAVSQDIRSTVWSRDGGRCVECGNTEYLEFDHIIPFSKGGATSVNNVQLLCRRCNLAKSDRI